MNLSRYEVFTNNTLSSLTPKQFEKIVNPQHILLSFDKNRIKQWIQNNIHILDSFDIFDDDFGYQAIQKGSYEVKNLISSIEIIFVEKYKSFWFPSKHLFYIDENKQLKVTYKNNIFP